VDRRGWPEKSLSVWIKLRFFASFLNRKNGVDKSPIAFGSMGIAWTKAFQRFLFTGFGQAKSLRIS
jgi:hypothetical protein